MNLMMMMILKSMKLRTKMMNSMMNKKILKKNQNQKQRKEEERERIDRVIIIIKNNLYNSSKYSSHSMTKTSVIKSLIPFDDLEKFLKIDFKE